MVKDISGAHGVWFAILDLKGLIGGCGKSFEGARGGLFVTFAGEWEIDLWLVFLYSPSTICVSITLIFLFIAAPLGRG